MDPPKSPVKGLESVILPGLFSEAAKFLDLETVIRLREQSTTLQSLIDKELKDQTYWRTEVAKVTNLDLSAFQLDWRKIYRKIKAVGITRTVMEAFPKPLLLQWLELNFDEDCERREAYLTKELIRADRIAVWDDYILLFQNKDILKEVKKDSLMLAGESDGRLKLFARLLREDKNASTYLKSIVVRTMKSSDIAHYMLVERLYPKELGRSEFLSDIVETCITLPSGSLEILSYLAKKYPKKVRNILEEILYGKDTYYSIYLNDIAEILIEYTSDQQFEYLASDIVEDFRSRNTPTSAFIRALVRDPRLAPEIKEKLVDLTADQHTSTSLDVSKYLEDMQIDVSTYISHIALKDTSNEVLGYLLTAKRMPAKYKKYINLILAYVSRDGLKFPKNLDESEPGSGRYTGSEARSLAFGVLHHIPECMMNKKVYGYFVSRLRNTPMHKESVKEAKEEIRDKIAYNRRQAAKKF